MKTCVVYATDENYVRLTAVSLCSLLAANPGIDIAIFADGISEASADLLKRLADRFNSVLKVVDVRKEIDGLRALKVPGYTSFSIYSRFFATRILCGDYDRFVYIDSDTFIRDDISGLIELPLDGRPFAVGYDCLYSGYKRLIGLAEDQPYFNSGVLLVDINTWREERCSERFFECLNSRAHQRLILPDQDVLAHSLADDAAILPPQYNFLTHFQMFRTRNDVLRATGLPASAWYTEKQYAVARRNPVIHHFLGHTLGRPWYRESLNPLRPLYKKMVDEAGLHGFAEQSRPVDFCYKVQYLAWKTLPPALFAWANRAMYAYFFRTRYGV